MVAFESGAHARRVHDACGAAVVQVGGESGGGGVVQGVGFVQDQDAVGRERHAAGFGARAAELGVGEDEVVVGDHDIGRAGTGASLFGPAVAGEGAERAFTGVDPAGEVGQYIGGCVGAEFSHVAGGGCGGPGVHAG